MIDEYFKKVNLKLTNQRKIIIEIINELDNASFKDIQDKCNEKMNKSTVYRIIELFLNKNIIIKNLDNDGNIYYSINKNEHKHYIYCVKCNKKKEINICPVDNVKNTGYKVLSHQININGICSECQKNSN